MYFKYTHYVERYKFKQKILDVFSTMFRILFLMGHYIIPVNIFLNKTIIIINLPKIKKTKQNKIQLVI